MVAEVPPFPVLLAIVIIGLIDASNKTAAVPAKTYFNITYSSFRYSLSPPSVVTSVLYFLLPPIVIGDILSLSGTFSNSESLTIR